VKWGVASSHYRHRSKDFSSESSSGKGLDIGQSGRLQPAGTRAARKLHSRVGLPPTSFLPSSLSPSSHRDKERIEKGCQRSELNLSQLAFYPTTPVLISDTILSLLSQSSRTLCRASLCRSLLFVARPTSRDDSNDPLFNFEIKEGKTAIRGKLDREGNGGSIKSSYKSLRREEVFF